MLDKKQQVLTAEQAEKQHNELIDLLNNGDLKSIKLGNTILTEEKLIALLALLPSV